MAIKSLGVCIACNSSMQTQFMSSLKDLGFSVIKTGCALITWHMFRVSSTRLSRCFSLFVAMLPMMACFSFGMFMMKSKGAL